MTYDICCIGHITHDRIITPRHTVNIPGGTAFYFAHAFSRLNDHSRFRLVTSLAETDMKAVDDIRSLGIDVKVIPSPATVYFENRYGADQNHRTQRVLAKAAPFTIDGLRDIDARICHLGTLLADDFSPEVVQWLASRTQVSADVQGYLREVRGESVCHIDWPDKCDVLRHIHTLKANEKEMQVLTGSSDPIVAARILSEWGVSEVLLTLGSEGSLIYAENTFHEIPAYPPHDVVDATGCGDTYMAGYLYKRSLGAGYDEAGRFAAAMCTVKLESSGPFRGTEEDIGRIIGC